MALGEDIPDMPEDKTVPKYRQIDKRAGPYVMNWGRELEAQISAWEQENQSAATTAPTKRSIVADTDLPGRGAKRAKTGDLDDVMSDEAMKKSFDRNEIGKLTVPVMKVWLQSKGLTSSGKKADLMDRLENWFETK
ncbi:MAG: hypothetical protein Q9195_002081 [Heterodermia aff. obscurata]